MHDRRQKFCTDACRNQGLLERFKERLGESNWKKKRHAYYEARKQR